MLLTYPPRADLVFKQMIKGSAVCYQVIRDRSVFSPGGDGFAGGTQLDENILEGGSPDFRKVCREVCNFKVHV